MTGTPLADVYVQARIDPSRLGTDLKRALTGSSVTGTATVAGEKAGASFGTGFNSTSAKSAAAGASKAGASAGKSFGSSFGSSLKTIGTFVGITAFASVLHDVNDEARESQKVNALTAAAIKSTGSAAGVTAKQVSDLAAAQSLKIGVDDELIQSGENVLLTFRNIQDQAGKGNDIFDQATVATLNLSAALDKDLKSSAIQVGKALNDPVLGVTALGRAGVQFTADQKATIASLVASGDTLDAQKIILAELTAEFGGAAESQKTAAGIASTAWKNLEEELGLKLMPVLDDVLTWFASDGVDGLEKFGAFIGNDVVPPVEALVHVIGIGVDAFDKLPGPVKEAAVAFGVLLLAERLIGPTARTAFASISSGAETAYVKTLLVGDAMKTTSGRLALLGTASKGLAGVGGFLALQQGAEHSGTALGGLETIAGATALGFSAGGPWGAAFGFGIGVLKSLNTESAEAAEKQKQLAASAASVVEALNQQTGAVTKSAEQIAIKSLQDSGAYDAATKLGVSWKLVTNAALERGDATSRLGDIMQGLIDEQGQLSFIDAHTIEESRAHADAINTLGDGYSSSAGKILDFRAHLDATRTAFGILGKDIDGNKLSLDYYGNAIHGADAASKDFRASTLASASGLDAEADAADGDKASLQGLRQVQLSMINRRLGLNQAILDSVKAADENTDGFNKMTDAGIKNYGVITAIASATDGYTLKTERGRKAIGDARQAIIDFAVAQGKSIPNAEKLADRLLRDAEAADKIPDHKHIDVDADTSKAISALDGVKAKWDSLHNKTITLGVSIYQKNQIITPIAGGGVFKPFAAGGFENHIAQIAAPTYRLWAEPETGGEAYIPLANDHRRPRARDIVSQVGHMFGMFADGGITKEARQQARADAQAAAKDHRADMRALEHVVNQFRIGIHESAGEVHDETAGLIKQLRVTFGKDSPIVKNMADLGVKMVEAARERDQVVKQLSDAVSDLHQLRQAQRQFTSSTTGAFTANPFSSDSATTVAGMERFLRDSIRQTRGFANAEHKLIGEGLSKPLIRQLVGSGPDAAARAQALAQLRPGQLAQFERLARIDRRQAARVGDQAGAALYDSGIKAAAGVVAGLRHDEDKITAQLERYAERAVTAVTRALGDGPHHNHHGSRGGIAQGENSGRIADTVHFHVPNADAIIRKQRFELHKLAVRSGRG